MFTPCLERDVMKLFMWPNSFKPTFVTRFCRLGQKKLLNDLIKLIPPRHEQVIAFLDLQHT